VKITIKARWSDRIIFEGEYESMKHAVQDAVQKKVSLSDSNLSGSDLSGSDLRGSNLSDSNLSGSDLRDSNLRGSNLRGSNLSGSDLRGSNLSGSNLSGSDLSGSNLSGSDLRGSNLRGSDLSGSDLRDSNLSGSDLRGSNLRGVPKIEKIHQAVYAAASATPEALDMGSWHACETTHCRAGWVVTLAGEAGKAMEWCLGTPAAAALIYLKSDPTIGKIPNFYADNEAAMEDMKRLAEQEAKAA